MTYFKSTTLLTTKEREQVSVMVGKIMLGILGGMGDKQIASACKISVQELNHNIDETLYTLKNKVGVWRYRKMLFVK